MLNIAARKGNIDIIQLLLKLPKIDVNIGSTIKYIEPMKYLNCFGEFYIMSEDRTIFHEAVESGFAGVVQFLLKNIAFDVNCKCIINKNYEDRFTTAHMSYKEVLEKNILHFAIERGNIEIIKLLLSNPNININMYSKSRICESGGCVYFTVSFKTEEKSSLYFAIKNGRIKLIQFLLEQPKIDIKRGIRKYSSEKKPDINEKTPLYLAVEKQNLEIVQLLSKQPDINVKLEIEALELASKIPNDQIHQFLLNLTKPSKIE